MLKGLMGLASGRGLLRLCPSQFSHKLRSEVRTSLRCTAMIEALQQSLLSPSPFSCHLCSCLCPRPAHLLSPI